MLKNCLSFLQILVFFQLLYWGLSSCNNAQQSTSQNIETIAANQEVAVYMKQFKSRGDQADDSRPKHPEEALAAFRYPEDLTLELLAAEPLVHQPVEINFDHRGRLWVVQYQQYPYPEGLKVTGVDYHLRLQFDTVPSAPPMGQKGADKITLLEDTNGDGQLDKATDAITGLNIVTAVTWGRGKIWVLNPPYLLAYPDPDGDGFPNGDPEVHLKGFGLEDTHAVANSLRWGPDGWLYGAQGSTTTATISSSKSKNVHFKGQGIWRYHPETAIFELFAEGGGNTFHVEFDDKGRIYSGHNGAEARGMYYKQGAYYRKNWGKHGPLTNPFAFGFFPGMSMDGEQLRFTHAFIRYGGTGFSSVYQDALIAINPLHNFVQLSKFEVEGSDFKTIDLKRILETDDHWFRPVDIKAGPDGGIYLADWYDSRLSHVNPKDTWHKTSGRIYRLQGQSSSPFQPVDFSSFSTEALIKGLAHPNRWHRQQALRQFGDRKNTEAVGPLQSILTKEKGQLALEALWAINLSGGFSSEIATIALQHADPFVRLWAVRLIGDQNREYALPITTLLEMAAAEKHPEVRSQLAATAKRLPSQQALPLIRALLMTGADHLDAHNPLLIWWALENKSTSNREGILDLFREKALWTRPVVQQTILERLMQRYVMEGGASNLESATALLNLAPSAKLAQPLLIGLEEGLRGRELTELSEELLQLVKKYSASLGESSLNLAIRNQELQAVREALQIISNPEADRIQRLSYIRTFGEIHQPEAIPVLLDVISSQHSTGAIRQAALLSLRRYDSNTIGKKVLTWYPDRLRADPDVRLAALELLTSRSTWAAYLLEAIEKSKRIDREDLPVPLIRQLTLLGASDILNSAERIWPELKAVSNKEKERKIKELREVILSRPGNINAGKVLYQTYCGTCHRLNGQGGTIGPELTTYDRSNLNYLLLNTVDPNASIREGYVHFFVETKDGRSLSGMVSDQSGGVIRLRSSNGNEILLPESQIARMEAQSQSLMPERILDVLAPEEVRDLFAYLMQRKSN